MKSFLAVVAAILFLLPAAHAQEADRAGTVVDGTTNSPLAGVTVTVGDKAVLTDAQGQFKVAGGSEPIKVRLPGYRRETLAAGDAGPAPGFDRSCGTTSQAAAVSRPSSRSGTARMRPRRRVGPLPR